MMHGRISRRFVRVGLLSILCACSNDAGSTEGPPIVSSNRSTGHRMTPEQLRQMTGVDRLPVPVDRGALMASVASHYPPPMRSAGVGGSALVDVTIDEQGLVSAVELVQRPLGPRTIMVLREANGTERRVAPHDDPAFGAAAQAALRPVRFTPAVRDGRPVPYTMRMTINFDPPAR
jgi:outer membrane biosynthesis protein TonB